MDPTTAQRVHDLFMDLVRATGMLQPDHAVPAQSLSLSQAFALHELDTDTPPSQQDLARRLGLEKSSVSRLVAEMERKGLVRRQRDPDNRRISRLQLTDQGRALHAGIAARHGEQFERLVSALTRDERDALIAGLTALVRVVRGGAPATGGTAGEATAG